MKTKYIYHMIKSYIPALFICCGILFIWELCIRSKLIDSYVLPAPSSIFSSLILFKEVIILHSVQTLLEAMIGLCISMVLGVLVAILLDSSKQAQKIVYPLLVVTQTVPIIALAPLLLIWFGFGILPKIIVVILYCFFPICIATASGFLAIPTDFVTLLKSMGASRIQIMKKIKIPMALPQFFSGLKIAVTYSITGAIVGEYVGSFQGLGVLIQTSANSHALGLVFASIFVVIFVSIIFFVCVHYLERVCMPWKYSVRKPK